MPNFKRGRLNLIFGLIRFHFYKSLTQKRPILFKDLDKFHQRTPAIRCSPIIRYGRVIEPFLTCFSKIPSYHRESQRFIFHSIPIWLTNSSVSTDTKFLWTSEIMQVGYAHIITNLLRVLLNELVSNRCATSKTKPRIEAHVNKVI